jgi:predicted amidohydrolase YtcJ
MTRHAERIITNGRLITFDAAQPAAQAIAVANGEIIAVGSAEDVNNLEGPDTIVHDANGATVLPGFIESHLHLFQGGAELDALNLSKLEGADRLKQAVDGYARDLAPDELLYAVCCEYTALGNGMPITRQALDAVVPDRPFAMIAHDHHTAWANSRALALAGILHGGDAGEGSEIVMADDGTASGELREVGAFGPVLAHTRTGGRESLGYVTAGDPDPPATPAQRATDKNTLERGLQHCARNGITSLHNMDGSFYQLALLDELQQEERLLCRAQIPLHLKPEHPLDKIADAEEMHRRYNSDMLWSGRVKMFMDGVHDSRTAFTLRGYPDEPDSTGAPLFSQAHFTEAAIACDARGLQIAVHAIGDAAVRRTLDGYQAAREANGARDSRHRVEHIEALSPQDLPRFAELGVIASMQPLHSPRSGFFKAWPEGRILHEDQLELAFAWQTIRKTGATVIFSSDWPVVPVEVMRSIRGACAHVELGRTWGDQHQSLHDALAGYTRDGAYAEFNEYRKGKLKAGMMADIVVMSHDLEAMSVEQLDQASAVLTLCGGRVTWQAG